MEKFTFNTEDTNYVSSFAPVPSWMSEEAIKTLNQGYLLPGECPRDLYYRVACQSARLLDRPEIMRDIFDILYFGFLGLATPVAANFGANRGLAISCFANSVHDSIPSIYSHLKEVAMMSKNGGGVASFYGNVRPSGANITGGGVSTGIVPVVQQYDKCAGYVAQGGVRRGSLAHYLPIDHPDAYELMLAKDHLNGDPRKMIDGNIAFTVTDEFMYKVLAGDKEASKLFGKALETNLKVGSPYFLFIDNVNKTNPPAYVNHNLKVETSNLCLDGDTKVSTKKGQFPIKELVGKTVDIFDGKTWVSNNNFFYYGKSDTYSIVLNNNEVIKMTPDHRCLIKKSRNKLYYEVLAKDLKVGQSLSYSQSFETEGFIKEKGAYLKGFLLGDGTSIQDRALLHLYHPKFACENALINSANELKIEEINTSCISEVSFSEAKEYQDERHFGKSIRKTMKGLSCRKKELYPWVSVFRVGLPENISQWTRKSRIEFLSGLLDADGTGIKTIQITFKNQELCNDVSSLIFSLGYLCSKDITKNKQGVYYRITINNTDTFKLFKEANFHRLSNKGATKPLFRNFRCLKIKEIIYNKELTDVYCTKVPSTTHFALANGVLIGQCSEITLFTDESHSFVCCLSSLNLAKWDEWKDWKSTNTNKTVVELSVYLLDSVIEEFIKRAKPMVGMGRAVRSAEKGRALGLGSMGLAYLYQLKNLPFKSKEARSLNVEIHKYIKEYAFKASKDLAVEYGEPEWCEGTGMRNSHLSAVAPTRTNSVITGAFSAGIEPIDSNAYTAKQAKGSFTRKNPLLVKLLQEKELDTPETWEHILQNNGSVLYLDSLSINEKLVFLTAREIDQEELIRQAADRAPYICQGQSLNRFIHPNIPLKQLSELVFKAWKSGIKSTYYTKSSSEQVLAKVKNKATIISKENCPYCEKTKKLFDQLSVDYIEYKREEVKYFPWKTVPQIWYEGHFIGGYSELLEYTAKLNKTMPLLKSDALKFNYEHTQETEDCISCSG